MLTKFDDTYVDLTEIISVTYIPEDEMSEGGFRVIFRNGERAGIRCEPEEMEAALIRAGLLPVEETILLDPDTISQLDKLYAEGYRWLARDADGKLFAYRHKPEREEGDAYWDPAVSHPEEAKDLGRDAFQMVSGEDPEPFDIQEALAD